MLSSTLIESIGLVAAQSNLSLSSPEPSVSGGGGPAVVGEVCANLLLALVVCVLVFPVSRAHHIFQWVILISRIACCQYGGARHHIGMKLIARVIRRHTAPSYLGNAARNEERIRLVVKCWRSSGVLCVAVRHEHYPPLPRPGGIAIDMLHCKFIFMYFCNEKWPFNR